MASRESTATVPGVNHQLLAVTEVSQWASPSCIRQQLAH